MVMEVRILGPFGESNDWERGMRETSGDIVNVFYYHLSASYIGVFTLKKVKLNTLFCANLYFNVSKKKKKKNLVVMSSRSLRWKIESWKGL